MNPFAVEVCGLPISRDPVWQAIARVLSDPTVITAELDRQASQEAHGQGERAKESQAIQKALASLEREAQRWDEAYGQAVIDIVELKAKKLDITDRRQRLLTQQEAVETATAAVQQDHAKRQDILTYCLRVKERLHTMDMPHKREALEALDIRVFWAPGEPHPHQSQHSYRCNCVHCARTVLARFPAPMLRVAQVSGAVPPPTWTRYALRCGSTTVPWISTVSIKGSCGCG